MPFLGDTVLVGVVQERSARSRVGANPCTCAKGRGRQAGRCRTPRTDKDSAKPATLPHAQGPAEVRREAAGVLPGASEGAAPPGQAAASKGQSASVLPVSATCPPPAPLHSGTCFLGVSGDLRGTGLAPRTRRLEGKRAPTTRQGAPRSGLGFVTASSQCLATSTAGPTSPGSAEACGRRTSPPTPTQDVFSWFGACRATSTMWGR